MLPRERRVPRALFPKSFGGRIYRGGFSALSISPNKADDKGKTRFAFVVSAKVAKKSVDRNLLKRRARDSVRTILPRTKDGLVAVYYFKKGAEAASFNEIKSEITLLAQKAGII